MFSEVASADAYTVGTLVAATAAVMVMIAFCGVKLVITAGFFGDTAVVGESLPLNSSLPTDKLLEHL
ncbi:hypothetical protein [Lentzea flaviverrucosa]|uniref:hypothetical protein n=1 Tax=Lentzea flaviverrucosa TaxID=200379 RepID=UPI0011607E33|nr:hypothetical protein [Lentzea flaviverrucosa]